MKTTRKILTGAVALSMVAVLATPAFAASPKSSSEPLYNIIMQTTPRDITPSSNLDKIRSGLETAVKDAENEATTIKDDVEKEATTIKDEVEKDVTAAKDNVEKEASTVRGNVDKAAETVKDNVVELKDKAETKILSEEEYLALHSELTAIVDAKEASGELTAAEAKSLKKQYDTVLKNIRNNTVLVRKTTYPNGTVVSPSRKSRQQPQQATR
ncbi:MAG: hypothetical protein ACK5LX_07480 [Oscillospiraceae bacterium]